MGGTLHWQTHLEYELQGPNQQGADQSSFFYCASTDDECETPRQMAHVWAEGLRLVAVGAAPIKSS